MSNRPRGSVIRLYATNEAGMPADLPATQQVLGASPQPSLVDNIGSLHRRLSQTEYTSNSWHMKGEDDYGEWESEFGEKGGELRGRGFALQIPRQKEWKNNHHSIHVTTQNPNEHVKMLEGSGFSLPDTSIFPILDVKIKAKKTRTNTVDMNLVLPTNANNEIDTEFVVLQQDTTGSLEWKDITNKCEKYRSDLDRSIVFKIPVAKSSKIWVIKVKRSFRSLIYVLLSLLFGKTFFRILVFSKIRDGKEVSIRVLGMCEELYQNPQHLKTDVHVAKEQGFKTVEESDAKELVRKGKLLLSFYLSGKCQKSTYLDLSGDDCFKVAQRHDFEYTAGESGCVPKIEVETEGNGNENVLWTFNLKNIMQEELEGTTTNRLQPDTPCLDGNEISDQHLLQVATKVAADWEKFGVCLGIPYDAIKIIDRDYNTGVVDKCFALLTKWKKETSGKITELNMALRDPAMQRVDVANDLLTSTSVEKLC